MRKTILFSHQFFFEETPTGLTLRAGAIENLKKLSKGKRKCLIYLPNDCPERVKSVFTLGSSQFVHSDPLTRLIQCCHHPEDIEANLFLDTQVSSPKNVSWQKQVVSVSDIDAFWSDLDITHYHANNLPESRLKFDKQQGVIIWFDVDGTLVDFISQGLAINANLLMQHNLNPDYHELTERYFQDNFIEPLRSKINDSFFEKGYFLDMPLYEGVISALNRLKQQGYELGFLTAPLTESIWCAQEKLIFLKKIFGDIVPSENFIISPQKDVIHGRKREGKLQILVEDNFHRNLKHIDYLVKIKRHTNTSFTNFSHELQSWSEGEVEKFIRFIESRRVNPHQESMNLWQHHFPI